MNLGKYVKPVNPFCNSAEIVGLPALPLRVLMIITPFAPRVP